MRLGERQSEVLQALFEQEIGMSLQENPVSCIVRMPLRTARSLEAQGLIRLEHFLVERDVLGPIEVEFWCLTDLGRYTVCQGYPDDGEYTEENENE
jgi:hypothetical protein